MLEAEIWLVDASAINLLGKKVEKSCAGPGAVVQVEEELSAGAARTRTGVTFSGSRLC
jgi:hypothetical protein